MQRDRRPIPSSRLGGVARLGLAFVLAVLGCKEPTAEPAPERSLEPGAARLEFQTDFSRGERSITLRPDGAIVVADQTVGSLANGKAVVDGVEIGTLAPDGTFTLAGFPDPAKVTPEGSIELGDAAPPYLEIAADGSLAGPLVRETAGMRGHYEGPDDRRDELAFLLMALTTARGPAIDKPAQPRPD